MLGKSTQDFFPDQGEEQRGETTSAGGSLAMRTAVLCVPPDAAWQHATTIFRHKDINSENVVG